MPNDLLVGPLNKIVSLNHPFGRNGEKFLSWIRCKERNKKQTFLLSSLTTQTNAVSQGLSLFGISRTRIRRRQCTDSTFPQCKFSSMPLNELHLHKPSMPIFSCCRGKKETASCMFNSISPFEDVSLSHALKLFSYAGIQSDLLVLVERSYQIF